MAHAPSTATRLPHAVGLHRCLTALVALALLAVWISPALAQYRRSRDTVEFDPSQYPTLEQMLEDAPEVRDDQAKILWRRYWYKYGAKHYTLFEGKPRQLAKWDPRYESSRHVTPIDLARQTRRQVTESMGPGWTRTLEVDTLTKESAQTLAKILPNVAPGEYGWVHSIMVNQVLGPEEMLVSNLWLLDEQATEELLDKRQDRLRELGQRGDDPFAQVLEAVMDRQNEDDFEEPARLVGYTTLTVQPEQRWTGPDREGLDLAVVAMENVGREVTTFANTATRGDERDRRMVLTPRDQVKLLDEEGFAQAIESWGMTRESFVRLLLKLMQEDPKLAQQTMLQSLETLQAGHEARLAAEAAAQAAAEGQDDSTRGSSRSRRGDGMSALERWRAAQQAKSEGGNDANSEADDREKADGDDDGEEKMSALERYRRLRGEKAEKDKADENADEDDKDAEAE